jgi:imidazolonepropionase-like amidohydrolase
VIKLGSERIFDGSGAEPFGGHVSISGERISEVRRANAGASTSHGIRLDGFSILPGLIDAHTHLGSVIQPHGTSVPLAVVASQIFANLRIALDEGFTTVRDVAGLDGGILAAMDRGLTAGPRILPSGPMLSQHGGHADWRPLFDHGPLRESLPGLVQSSELVAGEAAMRAAARTAFRDGATQLKVAISGGFSSSGEAPDDVQFGLEELRAAVEVAHSRHTYVTAHAHYPESIRLGLMAGIECFEHGTFADADTVEDLRAHGAVVVATLSVVERYQDPATRGFLRPEVAEQAREAFPAMCRMVRTAIGAGVTVGSGSDQVGPEQRGRGRELAVRAQVTNPLEAITAATGVNARILRLNSEVGQLAPGCVADLIAVEGDPAVDPELLADPSRVRLVVRSGAIWRNTLPEPLATGVAKAFSTKRNSERQSTAQRVGTASTRAKVAPRQMTRRLRG